MFRITKQEKTNLLAEADFTEQKQILDNNFTGICHRLSEMTGSAHFTLLVCFN